MTAHAFKQSQTTNVRCRSLDPCGVWASRAKLVKWPGLENDGWFYERNEAPAAVQYHAMRKARLERAHPEPEKHVEIFTTEKTPKPSQQGTELSTGLRCGQGPQALPGPSKAGSNTNRDLVQKCRRFGERKKIKAKDVGNIRTVVRVRVIERATAQ